MSRHSPAAMTAEDRAKARWGTDSDISLTGAENRRSSNSLFEDTNCPPRPRIGLDTISVCWSDPDAVDGLLRIDGLVPAGDHAPLRVVPAPGGSVRLNRRLDGLGQVGAFPGASLLYVEGRAGALERQSEADHALGSPGALSATVERVRHDLGRLVDVTLDPPAVRRVDLSGELHYERGEHGKEFLRLLDALHAPNHKTAPVRERGGPALETVYWRTPKRSVPVLRAYDKGVESGTAAAGERIRLERQVRFAGARRPSPAQFLARDLAELYVGPIATWLRNGACPGTAEQLIELLTDAAVIWPTYWSSGASWCTGDDEPGSWGYAFMWTARRVERILGTLAVVNVYGSSWPAWTPKQRQRRMREIRQLGLVVVDEPPQIDVDLEVSRLCDAWTKAA